VHVLITNDDGVDSPGIHALAQGIRQLGLDVTIAAPSWDSSGASASLTAVEHEGRVVVEPRTIEGLDATVLAIEAAPAFIARLGVDGGLGPVPDLVLSGINRGANTGQVVLQVVLHSGTVGAALTAGTQGVPAVALSLASAAERALWTERTDLHWATAVDVARRIVSWILGGAERPPGPLVLNVNVPDLPLEQLEGLRHATLATHGTVTTTVTEQGKGYVEVAFEQPDAHTEPGTDAALLADGYATYTPLRTVCEAPYSLADLGWASGTTLRGGAWGGRCR
jgi:5'-nucleotidase